MVREYMPCADSWARSRTVHSKYRPVRKCLSHFPSPTWKRLERMFATPKRTPQLTTAETILEKVPKRYILAPGRASPLYSNCKIAEFPLFRKEACDASSPS